MALQTTNKEPEYKKSPPLKISSVGTEIKKNSGQMPDGSALLTDTGNNSSLKNQGINYIIHAVPRHRSSCSSDEEFIEIATKAAQNSIILADREGIDELAICLIGGEIYRASCDPQKLAEGIIRGSINQLENCQSLKEITFVDWKGNSTKHFKKAVLEKFAKEINDKWKGKVSVMAEGGDICDKSTHGAKAIVNSENAQMSWGGGISGAIRGALGTEASNVDKQRKDLMKEFNDIINGKERGDNNDNPGDQIPNQNGNSDNPGPGKDKNKSPNNNQNLPTSDGENEENNRQKPNDKGQKNNENPNKDKEPGNNNDSKNNSDGEKGENNSNSVIPDSVKEYFRKNNVKSVELEGENWIITYKDKKEKKTISVANASELQGLKGYLQSHGITSLDVSKLNIDVGTNSSGSKPNGIKYWPWIFGGMGIVLVITIIYFVKKNRTTKK